MEKIIDDFTIHFPLNAQFRASESPCPTDVPPVSHFAHIKAEVDYPKR